MSWQYPLIILNVNERSPNDQHAPIAGAARTFSHDHQLLVLVNGSNNAIPDELFATMQGRFVDVDEMEQKTVEIIPEFIVLIDSLHKAS